VHLTAQLTLRTTAPGAVMAALRAAPPAQLGGAAITAAQDLAAGAQGLPPSDVITYWLDGARVVVRPSGTEPKLKVYFEVVEPVAGDLDAARRVAAARLAAIYEAAAGVLTPTGT
jgi:phosphomannomutase